MTLTVFNTPLSWFLCNWRVNWRSFPEQKRTYQMHVKGLLKKCSLITRGSEYWKYCNLFEDRNASCILTFFIRERYLATEVFIHENFTPMFIGGFTGRSGTTWVEAVLRNHLKDSHVIVGERFLFTLAQFRGAAYEFYQGSAKGYSRTDYLDYFENFLLKTAYKSQRIYGKSIPGGMLGRLVPTRAIKISISALKERLDDSVSLEQSQRAFGALYIWLFNYFSAVVSNGKPWISKEPSYGRHADCLMQMIPNARLVILARDGRDIALSMHRLGWCSSVKEGIDRWHTFSRMTLDALQNLDRTQFACFSYEDLVNNPLESINRVVYNILCKF